MNCYISLAHPTVELGLKTLVSTHFPRWEINSLDDLTNSRGGIREPKLVILDVAIANTIRDSRGLDPGAALIVMFDGSDGLDAKRRQQLGAVAYIQSSSPLNAIIQSLRTASSRLRSIPTGRPAHAPLSPRQKDLARLVLSGYSNKKIADSLGLSYGTVKNYMFDLMRVLRVNSRLELAIKIRERRLVDEKEPNFG